jgi:glycosyltransferase involved in cell wall biosynthesis
MSKHTIKRILYVVGTAYKILKRDGISSVFNIVSRLYKTDGWYGLAYRLGVVTRYDYEKWIVEFDQLTDEARSILRLKSSKFDSHPVISVLMPVYNPKPEWLKEAIESVLGQIYPHWEMCIADDASTDPSIRKILEYYANQDKRIKVIFREKNGHISAASNSALELVSGTWVGLLDHDDVLSEHALFWVAESINNRPNASLIYSDEDKIDETGKRRDPYFKCDWNVDLFYSQNMFCHFGIYRTELLRKVGGFRLGLEGSQDYDLVLRCIELISEDQIIHIPRILYHWRAHENSCAQDNNSKIYALHAGQRALQEHLRRLQINAAVELLDFGMYRVKYPLPAISPPLVSLIIPTRNGLQLLRQCIDSIIGKTTYLNYEIIIVDNGSDDSDILQYFKSLDGYSIIRIIRDDRPFNFSALNNAAVKEARGVLIGLINNDIEVITPGWLSEMVSHAIRKGVGAVGAKLWYPNNTLQHAGVVLGVGGVAGHSHKYLTQFSHGYFARVSVQQSFSAVTGACLIIRKEIYEEVGGLNEVDLSVAYNDIDFCLRIRAAGYRNIWTPYAELYHHESATRGYEDTLEKKVRFDREENYMKQKWGDLLLNDPAYSPNLSLTHEDFRLSLKSRISQFE